MRIKQMDGSIYDSRANENLRATVAEDKNEMGGVDDE